MESYEVTRKIFSWGPTYQVRAPGSDEVLLTVKQKLLSSRFKLTMVKGTEGEEVAVMTGNYLRTRFKITHANKDELADLTFPFVAIKQRFTLHMGGQEYKAAGGMLAAKFTCMDTDGQPLFEIKREQRSWKDKFAIHIHGQLPEEVIVFAAVVINQKYYERQGAE